MTNFLHTFTPHPVLISFGPFNIYFYGFLIVCAILLGSLILFKLAEKYQIDKNTVIDSSFSVVLFAILGARIYDVLLEFPYYLEHPLQVFMIWKGGLAIHGAIIGGALAIYFFAKKHKLNPILLAALYTPVLALGQAIGRWGNYFNQELFGLPTNLPWGIPILPKNRVPEFLNYSYFHPTFLYESIGSVCIFLILLFLHKQFIKKKLHSYIIIVASYLLLYSFLRFALEFVRIDRAPEIFGLRFPQLASLILAALAIYIINKNRSELLKILKNNKKNHSGSALAENN